MTSRITKKQALRAVMKKLPIVGNKELQQNLECMTDSLAEAYRIGAEEAQREIAARIARIIMLPSAAAVRKRHGMPVLSEEERAENIARNLDEIAADMEKP